MNKIILLFVVVFLTNCSPFHKLANKTQFGSENGYKKVYNSAAKLKSLTFGDFSFATNNKQYKSLTQQKTAMKDILFYGITTKPNYEYYVLLNPKSRKFDVEKFVIKDTMISKHTIVVLISKNAPARDIKFLTENIFAE
jgi:hypothetical protein